MSGRTPLALDLAAANLEQTTPATVLATPDWFLDFRIGSAGPDTPDRPETLHAAIDWNFSLPSDTEATAFCMASVFADIARSSSRMVGATSVETGQKRIDQ